MASSTSLARLKKCECCLHDAKLNSDAKTVSSKDETLFPRKLYMRCVKENVIPWSITSICTVCIEKAKKRFPNYDSEVDLVKFCIIQL